MLDHVFTDAISALRESVEGVLLERLAADERFTLDVVLGDTAWETCYGLPGERSPARVRADIGLVWPTWSQSAFRSWSIGESAAEPPMIEVSVVFRIQGLRSIPEIETVLGPVGDTSANVGPEPLMRSTPTVETRYSEDLTETQHAIEITYEGAYELGEDRLRDGSKIDADLQALGGWISASLVMLGDLELDYRPPQVV